MLRTVGRGPMSINHVDFGVMATSTDVTSIRAAEEARPVADQQNFQAQFREEVQNKDYFIKCDMSKYIAYIIDTLNHECSISELLNPYGRIEKLINRYKAGEY